jgi:translation initiation factor 2 alpha subunit (eIF-2alpha)
MPKGNKVLRYTIKTVIDVAVNAPGAIEVVTEAVEKGREHGTAEIVSVQVVNVPVPEK